jgi:predicted phage terminase large subunit-like protein
VIQVSYGDSLAERFGKRNREKITNFGNIFGVELDPSKKTSKNFMLKDHKGGMISAGVGGGLTGNPAHLLVIDDPIKNRQEADSERSRESLWDEFEHSMLSRLAAGAKVILIMTRWHEDDLAGRILENMPEVTTYVNYECECESENDPLGRKIGEPLCPEIGKDKAWLESYKKTFTNESGMRAWEALFQGHPTIAEGNILKKEWWQYYDPAKEPKYDQMVMSVDATFKDGERNDYVAISVWGKKENKIYLVKMVNEHLNFTATLHKIRLLKAHYPRIGAIYVEDAANGQAIIQTLSHEILGIIPVPPDKSKEARVNAVSFVIEAGNVYLPEGDPITYKFVEQCAKFPNDKHDDMVDSMSQALYKLAYSRRGRVLPAMREKLDWVLPYQKPKKRVDVGGLIRTI